MTTLNPLQKSERRRVVLFRLLEGMMALAALAGLTVMGWLEAHRQQEMRARFADSVTAFAPEEEPGAQVHGEGKTRSNDDARGGPQTPPTTPEDHFAVDRLEGDWAVLVATGSDTPAVLQLPKQALPESVREGDGMQIQLGAQGPLADDGTTRASYVALLKWGEEESQVQLGEQVLPFPTSLVPHPMARGRVVQLEVAAQEASRPSRAAVEALRASLRTLPNSPETVDLEKEIDAGQEAAQQAAVPTDASRALSPSETDTSRFRLSSG